MDVIDFIAFSHDVWLKWLAEPPTEQMSLYMVQGPSNSWDYNTIFNLEKMTH